MAVLAASSLEVALPLAVLLLAGVVAFWANGVRGLSYPCLACLIPTAPRVCMSGAPVGRGWTPRLAPVPAWPASLSTAARCPAAVGVRILTWALFGPRSRAA